MLSLYLAKYYTPSPLTAPPGSKLALQRYHYMFIIVFKYRLDIMNNKLDTIDLDFQQDVWQMF